MNHKYTILYFSSRSPLFADFDNDGWKGTTRNCRISERLH